MVATVSKLPRTFPSQIWRTPDANVPPTLPQRRFLKRLAHDFVQSEGLVPPMPLSELRDHAEKIIAAEGIDEAFVDFLGVMINNTAWGETLAAIPFERRLLMMPKCLRKEAICPAPIDELGLLCKSCGQCSLQDLQEEAERLGYAVLIAEGSALVTAIIETGKVDAIVGVSCLSVLEKAFPFMEAAAIPGIAIPLLQGDCIDTNVDLDEVWDVIHITSEDKTRRMNLEALRNQVCTWFEPPAIEAVMGPAKDGTERLARAWLAKDGKRWRPFLAACALQALQEDPEADLPEDFRKVALAVECFHKASLIHDDIEDDDDLRYGQPTLHAEHGVPVALNAGDLLIGEGYRLIAECAAQPTAIAEMIRIAADGQRSLCLGQGAELAWLNAPGPLSPTQVVDIFSKKTAPAFEVALRLGAAYAGAGNEIHRVLAEYSTSLGIAYQVRDDLLDARNQEDPNDIEAMRPTILLAFAHQKASGAIKADLANIWRRDSERHDLHARVTGYFQDLETFERVENLFESYKEEAVNALKYLENATLKGLLRRVIGKIFNDFEIKEWCREFETRNASSSEALPTLAV